ncbi:hypothetical protein S100390_v1c06450 [Spiroplasma sp. NBRC 100390]|uniref:hypothetical protein n=1 Tax=unclassified Spiroplasma TaxID=2637901 RepID=UPI0008928EA6|nr:MULTISPECIES: hypothetical protein [unclassified Spiroplasma]AOX43982.1 hypothetical protein STU14_v1c06450 [Spiroplasma sp. TU-14]APE13452.1 hypothetical protein S100390_v1c06450 [Spiroplasma sp. NBRC 100390]
MKKFLLLFATTSITAGAVIPTTLKLDNTNLSNTIFNPVHYSFHKDNSNGKTNTLVEINLFSYTSYSNSWNDFITHYKTLSFLNFDAAGGGSGSTYDNNSFLIATNRLMTYSSIVCHYIYNQQDVSISLKFQEIKGYIFAIAQIITANDSSSNIWATLQIGTVIIY